jgi:hypothetical protein
MAQLQATAVNGTLSALREEVTTTASRTLTLSDQDKVVTCTNSSAITITVPANTTVAFPIGSVVYVAKVNTGTVTLAAEGGVTLSRTGTLGNNEELYIRKRDTNNWIVIDRPYPLTGAGGTITPTGNFSSHTFTSGSSTFTVQS